MFDSLFQSGIRGALTMVFALIAHVYNDDWKRLAVQCQCAVAVLPLELWLMTKRLIDGIGTRALQLPEAFSEGDLRWYRCHDMNVVLRAAGSVQCDLQLTGFPVQDLSE